MSASSEARLSALDALLDDQRADESVAEDLFSVVDALSEQSALRRALTDPTTPDEARAQLVGALFTGRIGDEALRVLSEAAKLRWGTSGALAHALERQGVRALLIAAHRDGVLDDVEDELFRIGRVVESDRRLRAALADRRVALDPRADLIGGLVAGRARPATLRLARRAVAARERTFDRTLEGYLTVAAELRRRAIATVTVARPLTADQYDRLQAALSRQVGREVTLHVVVDANVIGGVRVSLGDEVIDGTVAGKLHDAERKLA